MRRPALRLDWSLSHEVNLGAFLFVVCVCLRPPCRCRGRRATSYFARHGPALPRGSADRRVVAVCVAGLCETRHGNRVSQGLPARVRRAHRGDRHGLSGPRDQRPARLQLDLQRLVAARRADQSAVAWPAHRRADVGPHNRSDQALRSRQYPTSARRRDSGNRRRESTTAGHDRRGLAEARPGPGRGRRCVPRRSPARQGRGHPPGGRLRRPHASRAPRRHLWKLLVGEMDRARRRNRADRRRSLVKLRLPHLRLCRPSQRPRPLWRLSGGGRQAAHDRLSGLLGETRAVWTRRSQRPGER